MPPRDPLSALRARRSELENHHIDELVAGRLSRRDFLRRGAVVGMSTGTMAAVLAACGSANKTGGAAQSSTSSSSAPPTKGGTLALAIQTPAAAINPLTISDPGGLCLIGQTGEFLALDAGGGMLTPVLATKWSPSQAGKVWTFTLRSGVTFHNGAALTADDVVWTFRQLTDPKNASNALSTLGSVLAPAGVRKVDDHTVAFHLEAANGNFPYLVSSDNYNAIIVPAGTDYGSYEKSFVGTGPFVLKSYTQNQGASFTANPNYWGGRPHLDGTSFTFYESQQPQLVALQGGQVDVVVLFTAQGAGAILHSSQYRILRARSSIHRELSMRVDRAPFDDVRVRQAIALTLDRPAMVSALLTGDGQVGNDSPFAPKFASTDTSVPQRAQNLAKAKALLSAAGHPHGFSATLTTEQYAEIPQLAQVIAQSASRIGVDIKLKVESQSAYYGKATYGNSDWLDAPLSLVDYGDRGVPNVFLQATLTAKGPWNAAHFRNAQYDRLVADYVAAVDLSTQRGLAGRIERLLLEQTPLVIPYWIDGLTATTGSVSGVIAAANGGVFLKDASKSA